MWRIVDNYKSKTLTVWRLTPLKRKLIFVHFRRAIQFFNAVCVE